MIVRVCFVLSFHNKHAKKLRTYSFVVNIVKTNSGLEPETITKLPHDYDRVFYLDEVQLPPDLARLTGNLRLNMHVFRVKINPH